MAFSNTYHRRQVADTASKPCYVCYKSTATVLNQEESKDWFFICAGHLTDRGFAQPVIDPVAEAEKQFREDIEKEIKFIKDEYEEKMKKKGKSKDKDKELQKKKDEIATKEETQKDQKVKELEEKKDKKLAGDDGPRVFNLHKSVYQMRLTRLRNAQQAKMMKERLKNAPAFPSAPNSDL